jgi:hypothetical protein
MSKLQDITSLIENLEFEGRYLIHSGFGPVLSSLAADSLVKELLDLLRENTELQLALVKHIKQLIHNYQAGSLHGLDIPILAYLYMLDQLDNIEALNEVIHEMPQATGFFWAKKLALKIYQEKLQHLPEKP